MLAARFLESSHPASVQRLLGSPRQNSGESFNLQQHEAEKAQKEAAEREAKKQKVAALARDGNYSTACWGNIGIMENKIEAAIMGYIGVVLGVNYPAYRPCHSRSSAGCAVGNGGNMGGSRSH